MMPLPKTVPGDPLRASDQRAVALHAEGNTPRAGRGIAIRRGPAGSSISQSMAARLLSTSPAIDAPEIPPLPFDIRLVEDSGVWKIQAWLTYDETMLVTRNSATANYQQLRDWTDDGWVTIYNYAGAPSGTLYVTVEITIAPHPSGTVEYGWVWNIQAPETTGIDNIGDPDTARPQEIRDRRADTPVLVAVLDGATVTQLHRGNISTWGMDADSLVSNTANKSISVVEDSSSWQLYKWEETEYFLETPIPLEGEAYDRAQILVRLRGEDTAYGEAPKVLQYASLGMIAQAILDAIQTPNSDYEPEDSPWKQAWDSYVAGRIENLMGGGDIEEIVEGNAAEIYRLLKPYINDDFWQTGGNYTTCWGSSIGNAGGAGEGVVIDLANYRLMQSTGIKTVDWDNCQAFAPYNQWKTIDWEAMTLYSHVRENNPVKALDWNMCTTYDAAENLTMSWRTRGLYGAWSVAAGGSFATPSLALGGTTVTGVSTVAVVTAVDFGAQTVTTQNVKVLT